MFKISANKTNTLAFSILFVRHKIAFREWYTVFCSRSVQRILSVLQIYQMELFHASHCYGHGTIRNKAENIWGKMQGFMRYSFLLFRKYSGTEIVMEWFIQDSHSVVETLRFYFHPTAYFFIIIIIIMERNLNLTPFSIFLLSPSVYVSNFFRSFSYYLSWDGPFFYRALSDAI